MVHACVCVREREREREKMWSERKRKIKRERERMFTKDNKIAEVKTRRHFVQFIVV